MVTAPLGRTLRDFDRLFGRGTVAGLSDGQLLGSYVEHRDEAAFAAVVARYGPMVLSVCRGVLRDPLDAEDAYQATFLILMRKAGTVRRVDALGGWLHRVAHRVALQARADAAHRRTEEQKAGQNAVERGSSSATAETEELRRVLHAEIDRLPERLRLPLVLCDLEGLTREEAAGRLRWTEGTVRGRLARAKRLLRDRLSRRGVAVSASALAATLAGAAKAALPEVSLASTFARTAASALANRVMRAFLVSRLLWTATLTVLVAAVGTSAGLLPDLRFTRTQRSAGSRLRLEGRRGEKHVHLGPGDRLACGVDDAALELEVTERAVGPENRLHLGRRELRARALPLLALNLLGGRRSLRSGSRRAGAALRASEP